MTAPEYADSEPEPADVPDGWVVWVEDGKILMGEDAGGSPGSWPAEEDS